MSLPLVMIGVLAALTAVSIAYEITVSALSAIARWLFIR